MTGAGPSARRVMSCWMLAVCAAATACTPSDRPSSAASGTAGVASSVAGAPSAPAPDARIDADVRAACALGDSLLRHLPPVALEPMQLVPFDSVWPGDVPRWGCRVMANGHTKTSALSVDTLWHSLEARGWNTHTMISADGPDGTVVGLRHRGVTCVIDGRWDGGDDSDTTYVPSDDIEVRVGCARTIGSDTLFPPFTPRPQPPATSPAAAPTGALIKHPDPPLP